MEILAVIPARGGSKGVPGKNIKMMAGKPLIAHSIAAAKASRLITRAVITTDDEKIAAVAREYGGEAPFMRPKELAEDNIPDWPVFEHCLKWLEEHENYKPDLVVHLRPTSPLRRKGIIDKAIQIMINNPAADALKSVAHMGQTPLKMWQMDNGSRMTPFIPESVYGIREAYNMPRQKLPKHYVQMGVVDVIRPKTILEKKSMSGGIIYGLEVPEEDAVAIDTLFDFELTELLMNRNKELFIYG